MSEKRVGRPGKVFRCAFVISTMILRWQRIGLSLCRQSLLGACPWRPQQEVKSIWRPSYSQETSQWVKIISVWAFLFSCICILSFNKWKFQQCFVKTIAWMPLQKLFDPIFCVKGQASLKDDKETRSSFNLLLLTYWAENVFLTLVRKRFLVPSNSDHVEVLNQGGPLTDWFSKYYIYLLILIMHSDKYLILLKYTYTLQIKRYVPYHLAVLSKL